MSWAVYVLYSRKDEKMYVGCTTDIEKRIRRHSNGHVPATAHRRPVVLIHFENFSKKADAFQRERFLKSLWGAREKKKILNTYLKRLG
jgi:putative endonuclease